MDLNQKKSKKEPVKISKKIKFEKYKGDDSELKGKDIRKSFRLKRKRRMFSVKKEVLKRLAEIKDIVKSPLLNYREKIKLKRLLK